jgi:microcystin-dependent protein
MAEPFLGQLLCVGFNYAPTGWALCQGQLLSIAENSALFSLLGTTYGGDGINTFGVPDLQGRSPIGFGQGPGLSNYSQGEKGGVETVTLNSQQMPLHSHGVGCLSGDPRDTSPVGGVPAGGGSYSPTGNATMAPTMIQPAGGGQAHENRAPYLVLNWIIALEGIYPQRS